MYLNKFILCTLIFYQAIFFGGVTFLPLLIYRFGSSVILIGSADIILGINEAQRRLPAL